MNVVVRGVVRALVIRRIPGILIFAALLVGSAFGHSGCHVAETLKAAKSVCCDEASEHAANVETAEAHHDADCCDGHGDSGVCMCGCGQHDSRPQAPVAPARGGSSGAAKYVVEVAATSAFPWKPELLLAGDANQVSPRFVRQMYLLNLSIRI